MNQRNEIKRNGTRYLLSAGQWRGREGAGLGPVI